jgi:hypothetical protein
VLKKLTDLAYIVVKDHVMPDGTQGVELRQGDVIKIGRVPYIVK